MKASLGPALARANTRPISRRRDRSTPCPLCGGRTRDGLLCRQCSDSTGRRLAELPALWVELQLTLTRRARLTPPGSGRSAETPLAFNDAASRVAHRVVNGAEQRLDGGTVQRWGVLAWARWLSAGWRIRPDAGGFTGLVEFLAANLPNIVRSSRGADFASDVWAWGDAIRSAIDYPWERKIKAGLCPEMCEDAPCVGELWAVLSDRPGDSPVVVCLSPLRGVLTCGSEWEAHQWSRLGERITARQSELAQQAKLAAQVVGSAA